MKQRPLFDDVSQRKYNQKVGAPIYEPRGVQPNIITLADVSRYRSLLDEIERSSLADDEKAFLRLAAARHIVFHYERIGDYYAHASAEMKDLMERSALVIIDYDRSIELGFWEFNRRMEDIHGR